MSIDVNKREQITQLITDSITHRPRITMSALWGKLTQSGKLSGERVSFLVVNRHLDSASDAELYLIYNALWYDKWPAVEEMFTAEDIQAAKEYVEQRPQSKFPLHFSAVKLSDKNEFGLFLTAQEIVSLATNGVLQVRTDMQRETEITSYHGELISHVRYNDEWARMMGDSFVEGTGYASALRWNLVVDGQEQFEYDEASGQLTIFKGAIAIIGGQHRSRGLEYALFKNPDLNLKMCVFLTIEGVERAQFIINQDENRLPINRNHKASLEDSTVNRLIRLLQASPKMGDYVFGTTTNAIRSKAAFILTSQFGEALVQYYKLSDKKPIRASRLVSLSEWLSDFFMELEESLTDEFESWKEKTFPTLCPNAFNAYVMLSAELQGNENWKNEICKIIPVFRELVNSTSDLKMIGVQGHIKQYILFMKEAIQCDEEKE